MKKRILHVLPSLAPGWTTTQLRWLARELPADEFEMHACVMQEHPAQAEAPLGLLPVYRVRLRRTFDTQALAKLRQHVAKLKPDLVHGWSGSAVQWAHTIARAAGMPKLVVSYSHAGSQALWLSRLLNRTLIRRASAAVAHCRAVHDQLAARGWPADKLRVIAHGVEPPTGCWSRGELLAELGVPQNVFLIGAVAELRLPSRGKDIIWAADMLKFIRDDVHLLIFGDGPQRARLERFRSQVRIEDKVHFLGLRTDLPRWLVHLDSFWSGREDAGQPLALMEAMAAGVPAIATDVPGTRELITHGESGILVPVGDRAGLGRAAHKLLEDRTLAQQIGAAGKARMLAEFPLQRMAAAMAELYREL